MGAVVLDVPEMGHTSTVRQQAQTIANLQRAAQIATVAAQDLRRSLADREEEISALRADLAFYSSLVGSGERHGALAVHGVQLQPVPDSRAFNITIILTQSAQRGEENSGKVTLAVQGVRNGKLERLSWKEITTPESSDGLSYAFRYFQQLHGSIMLPEGFTPNRLRVELIPDHGDNISHIMAWSDALNPAEKQDVQQQSQPVEP